MKRILLILLLVIMLMLCACGKDNYADELERLERLAQSNEPEAICSLAVFHENRFKYDSSKFASAQEEASRLYMQAAEQGYYPAMQGYAEMQSWANNHKTAYIWMNLAVAFSPQNLQNELIRKRDEYAKKLSKEDLGASQDEALELYEKITGTKLYDPQARN